MSFQIVWRGDILTFGTFEEANDTARRIQRITGDIVWIEVSNG